MTRSHHDSHARPRAHLRPLAEPRVEVSADAPDLLRRLRPLRPVEALEASGGAFVLGIVEFPGY